MSPHYTLEQLIEILEFKREEMSQMLLVSTLLAVLAMTAVAVLVTGPERGRLRSFLLSILTSSTLIFIFATILDACICPGMKRNATHPNALQIQALVNLSQVAVWSLLIGTAMLFAGLGSIGFLYSRRIGAWTLSSAVTILAIFIICCFYLDHAMRI